MQTSIIVVDFFPPLALSRIRSLRQPLQRRENVRRSAFAVVFCPRGVTKQSQLIDDRFRECIQ